MNRGVLARLALGGALLGLLGLSLAGCAVLAEWTAPAKRASAARTPQAERADELFWRVLHTGAYERILEALSALTAAYVADPNDPVTAAHVGFLHIWRLSERRRLPDEGGPTITDHAVLGRKYFEEAVRLDPGDARYRGFHASLLMAEGAVHKDQKLLRRGFFALQEAVTAWPEFNLFTAGYVAGLQPHDSTFFRRGLEALWRNAEICTGEPLDRADPDYTRYMARETRQGPQRVCWNSWIAPHNFEGFFLHFGDMLVKAGEPARAVVMYANARLTRDYASWPYRSVLEERIVHAERNVALFRRPEPAADGPVMMVRSAFACAGCHQQ
jgi:hypothetical protein